MCRRGTGFFIPAPFSAVTPIAPHGGIPSTRVTGFNHWPRGSGGHPLAPGWRNVTVCSIIKRCRLWPPHDRVARDLPRGSATGGECGAVKFVLIDDHGLFRSGIRQLIAQAYPGCGILEAATAEDGLVLARRKDVDLILLDLRIPATAGGAEDIGHGLALLGALGNGVRSRPVIVMTGEPTPGVVDRAAALGAASIVAKSASPSVLFAAIAAALPARDPDDGMPSEDPTARGAISHRDLAVTPREFEILRLALRGNPPWKIALILGINGTNVRRYLSRLYAKFGVLNLCGLQSHFARTGQVMAIISSPSSDQAP